MKGKQKHALKHAVVALVPLSLPKTPSAHATAGGRTISIVEDALGSPLRSTSIP
jgi:hypothetical protein